MANNKIQIKRSVANSTVTGLANGELAYTSNGEYLYIGAPNGNGTSVLVGGLQVPGTLTNGHALVANSTGAINKVIVANLNVTEIWANGSSGSTNYILFSGGAGSNVYWLPSSAVSVNADSQYTWTNTQTFSNTITFNQTINATSNNASYLSGKSEGNLNVNSALTSNSTTYINGNTAGDLNTYASDKASNAYSNAMSDTLSRSGSYTGNNSFGGTNTVFSSNVVISSTNLYASSAKLTVLDIVASGNLTINGTLTTVNTNNLVVRDNMIAMADGNVADSLDSGFYVTANVSGTNTYSGLARIHGTDTFKLFKSTTEPTSTVTVDDLDTLMAYLNSNAGFVANSSNVQITASSTVGVNIVANTIQLSSALTANYGGTGISSPTNNAILVGNSSSGYTQLSLGNDGTVLQSNGTSLVYDTLDGGTF